MSSDNPQSTRWLRRAALVASVLLVPGMVLGSAALARFVLSGGYFSVCDPSRFDVLPGLGGGADILTLWQDPPHPVLRYLAPARTYPRQPPYFRCYYLVHVGHASPSSVLTQRGLVFLKTGLYGVELDIYGYYIYGPHHHPTYATPSSAIPTPPQLLLPLD
jgi:hypothetical protein